MKTQISYIWTEDNLRLPGIYYHPDYKDLCVLFVHGMSGNLLENYFGHILGKHLSKNGYGFLYSHNRGYNHLNDITTKEIDKNPLNGHKKQRIGAVYERFTDCLHDIEAWYQETIKQGYQKIILMGHSLGCNKSLHYLNNKHHDNIRGLILLSPPDMVANGKEAGKSKTFDKLLSEAKQNIKEGNPGKLLSQELWDWYTLSSRTFLDLFEDYGPADNLPIMRNPSEFPELASLRLPILSIMGEYDDIVINSLSEDMEIIRKKAKSAVSFDKVIIPGANHTYEDKEQALADAVLKWIKEKTSTQTSTLRVE